jgi:hypothetical protein
VPRRAATGRSECVLDVALSNQHSAVIGLLKVNLLAISPKEFRAYSAAPRNVRVAEHSSSTGELSRAAFIAAQGRAYECQRYATEVSPLCSAHETGPKNATIWRTARSVYF